jgi:hypothetical protein
MIAMIIGMEVKISPALDGVIPILEQWASRNDAVHTHIIYYGAGNRKGE